MGKASRSKKESVRKLRIPETRSSEFSANLNKKGLLQKPVVHILLIIALGFLAYSNTFHSPFQWDERAQILENPVIKDIDNFISSTKGYEYVSSHYNPRRAIGYLTFALNYHFGGINVTGYHIVNLLVHIVNALLVYFLMVLTFRTPFFRRSGTSDQGPGKQVLPVPSTQSPVPSYDSPLTSHYSLFTSHYSRFIALFSALLFISHPLQTQAVTYVVQRFASLAAMFYLLSLLMYAKGRLASRQAIKPSSWQAGKLASLSLSFIFAVLAMKTKEIAFTLPLVIIIYEFTFFKSSLRKKLLFLLPVLLTLIIVSISVLHSDKSLGEMLSDVSESTRVQTSMSRWDYLLTQMRVITTYIRLIFLPVNQNLDYDYPLEHSLFTPPVFFSLLFLLSLFGVAIYLLYISRREATVSSKKLVVRSEQTEYETMSTRVRDRNEAPDNSRFTSHDSLLTTHDSPFTTHYSRLIGFGILWFFITLSVESSIIPIRDVIFEHRVYLPSVGLFAAITTGVLFAAQRLRMERIGLSALVLIILTFSGVTYARNTVWMSKISLWEDVIKKSPYKARAHNNLGIFYSEEGHLDKGRSEFQTALEINPAYPDAHYNLGKFYFASGRMDEALREFQAAVRLKPDYADAHNNLGAVYETLGRVDDAIREYQTSLQIDPDHVPARNNLERQNKMAGDKR